MRTIFCAGRWIFLLMLAGAMLPSELKGNKKDVQCYLKSYATIQLQGSVGESCCYKSGPYVSGVITKCVQQKPTKSCNSSDYAVQVEGKFFCIKSDSKWMKNQIKTGKVTCE